MRLPSCRRKTARREPLGLAVAAVAALAPSFSQAIQFKPAPSANLDLSNLGSVGIAGDFSGISLYEFEGQVGKPRSKNGSESILAPLPNGALASVVSSDASIRAMCVLKDRGVVLAGNFTSLDGTQSTAIAMFNATDSKVTPMNGIQGEINALYCDNDSDTVYMGGSFKGSNSTNAISWKGDTGWSNLPFAGFNGPVSAITKASNGHMIFGGSFTGLGNISTPSQPDQQIINIATARVIGENHIDRAGFDNPNNIVCASGEDTAGNTYLLPDNSPGFWEAQFDFTFEPTKLRLWNTNVDGRGTKTFRVLFPAQPTDGILNITYVDPDTGKNATCTRECPLQEGTKPQDFHFVNSIAMDRIRIAMSDCYGPGCGLAGVELYEDNISAYAISSLNEATCRGVEFPAKATSTGPWSESPSLQSDSKYLMANVNQQSANQTSVVFYPNIQESGNYSVNLYTPGCKPDNSCQNRGRVNVTGTMASGPINSVFTTSLYQTNNFDKYDQIYFGYIEKTSDEFKPSVTLTAMPDSDQQDMTVVAQRVGFTLLNSNGGLNGLFDFDPTKPVPEASELSKSAINKLGESFDKMSGVHAVASSGDTVFVGGNFTSKDYKNVVAIASGKNVQNLDGGLNGEVRSMHLEGKQLYAGGVFNNTLSNNADGLNNVAVYDTEKNSWSSLGAGVDGPVEYVVPLQVNITKNTPEVVIAMTGTFSTINQFKNSDAIPTSGFAIWVPSQGNWLQNSPIAVPTYSGTLTASVLGLPYNGSLLAGSISSAQLGANGAAKLDSDGLGAFPVKISPAPASGTSKRRARSLTSDQLSGVVTGAYYQEGDKNITVLAGHFTARDANGTAINNLVLIDGKNKDSISGLGEGISADSSIVTVALKGSTLFAGGKLSGTVNNGKVSGLVAYDVASKSFQTQPAPISGRNGTVSAITVRSKTNEVYVAGSFDTAGALFCPGICMYNTETNQWNRPGNTMDGDVNGLMWFSSSKLIVAGMLNANSTERPLVVYDASAQSWSDFPGAEVVPGAVQHMTPGSSDGQQVWVSGKSSKDQSVFLMKYTGEKWLTVNQSLPATTQLRSLQIFTLTKDHDNTELLNGNQVLMLTGTIDLPVVGTVSAAIFNGTHYLPYALTTSSGSGAGSISKIFSQNDDFFASSGGHLALGFVVLIGLAISLALILLIVVAGVVLDRIRKKREGYTPAPTSMYDRGSGIQRVPPRELLESLGKTRPSAPHV